MNLYNHIKHPLYPIKGKSCANMNSNSMSRNVWITWPNVVTCEIKSKL